MPRAIAPAPPPRSSPVSASRPEAGRAGPGNAGFALYIHWPFCQAKCPYCDFNSHVAGPVDDGAWRRAYLAEIGRVAELTGPRTLRSIFFGGGTPSLMAPGTVAAIVDAAAGRWTPEPDCEVTLEANPTSVEAGRFAGYRVAGVNRASVGVQALSDPALRRLGRLHGAAEAVAAVTLAQAVFDRVSLDLIYARQHQTAAAWRRELAEAIALGTEHLSLYQLTIEPGTAFGVRHAAGRLAGLPDEDRGADLWDMTQELCDAAGLPAYETSNHARPGSESRHNLVYWEAGDYAGIGPGAHGRLTLDGRRMATEAVTAPAAWLAAAEGGRAERATELSPAEAATEALVMGLRLTRGVPLSRIEPLMDDGFRDAVSWLAAEGLVAYRGGVLTATEAGRPVLNGILAALTPDQTSAARSAERSAQIVSS